jgi:membrane associated rhomboid family serine protease
MGIYDRDYYRDTLPRGGFGHFSAWSVTTWLIIVNVVVFFAGIAIERAQRPPQTIEMDGADRYVISPRPMEAPSPLMTWGEFSVTTGIFHGQVWRAITYQFLHVGFWHLAVNMLGLFFFGPIVEAHFGGRRYLAFYLICGIAGALSFAMLAFSHVLHTNLATPLVGASASIFGLLVAAAVIAPHVEVFYFVIPLTISILAIGAMLLAVYTVIAMGNTPGGEAGGQAAHLGGGIMGFVLMKNQHWLSVFAPVPKRAVPPGRPRRRVRAQQKDWSKDFNR